MFSNRLINIPKPIWKLHGQQAYSIDILLTYSFAFITGAICLYFSLSLPIWKVLLIAILSVDIGGGVVSNFTRGTIDYYRQSALSPHSFIWLHLVQISVLLLLFWEKDLTLLAVAVLPLIFSSMVVHLHQSRYQNQVASFLFALFLLLTAFLPETPLTFIMLLILMGFKLIMGFSAHWQRNTLTN